ncbi:MAG: MFS transporter [Clostridia bacterium]|nr:MFS transporter [Clostridia bacterium]
MNKAVRPVGMRDYFGYAMGDFGCNMSFALTTNYMMLFFTQYIGVSLQDWAWIIIVGKIWDAINDPLIGGLVDRVRLSQKSKFTPWITIGGLMLVICTTLTFLPLAGMSYGLKVAYCLIAYCVWSVAYTTANVPYGAMHSAITDDPGKRTNLSTFRSIGAGLAQGPLMLLPLLIYDENDDIKGDTMVWIALVCSVIGFIGFMLVRTLVTERVQVVEQKEKFNYGTTIKAFIKNKPLLALCFLSVINIVCFMSMTSVNQIIFQSYFHNTELLTIANYVSYLPMIIVMPLVGIITKKIGKRGFLLAVNLIGSVAGVIMLLLPLEPAASSSMIIWMVGLMFVFLSNAGFGIIVWAMVVDCIDYGYEKTGIKEEGSTYAIYSFFRKFAQGIGSSFSALALAACGYVEDLGAAQTAETALNIKNMYLLVMTVGVIASFLVLFFFYNIKEKKQVEEKVA